MRSFTEITKIPESRFHVSCSCQGEEEVSIVVKLLNQTAHDLKLAALPRILTYDLWPCDS
jgi:hypothetical protein